MPEPRRRDGGYDRRRENDRVIDLLSEDIREIIRRLDRYWAEQQALRQELDKLRDSCQRDARDNRLLWEKLVAAGGVAQSAKGSNLREFFVYIVGTVGALGVTIAGIIVAVPGH